jgi:hypothetical protein
MDTGKVISEAAALLTRNPVMVVPTMIAALVFAAISIAALEAFGAEGAMAFAGPVGIAVNLFAQGVTMAMAREAMEKGATGLGTGTRAASGNFPSFLGAALVMSAAISVGLALFVFPGVVAVFLLMFTFPSIVVDGLGAHEAIKRGFGVIRENLKKAALLFAVLVGVSFLFGIVNILFRTVPVMGPAISIFLSGIFGGYIAVVMVRAYMAISGGREGRGHPLQF